MCSENYHWDFSVILPIDIWLHQNTKQFSNLSSTLSSGHKNQLLCTQQIIVCAGNIVLGNEGIYLFRVTHSCRMNYSKPAVQFHFKHKVKKLMNIIYSFKDCLKAIFHPENFTKVTSTNIWVMYCTSVDTQHHKNNEQKKITKEISLS